MRRTRVALLAGCLLAAGGFGTGTASGHELAAHPSIAPAQKPTTADPDFPGPDPRVVEPDRRTPGTMPEVVPRGPRSVPMPELLRGPRSRPVPMPELGQHDGELVIPPPGPRRSPGPVLPGGSQSPGD